MPKWERLHFHVPVTDGEPVLVSGPAYRGLAMVRIGTGCWSLTHVKSGHRIFKIQGERAGSYKLAEGIADLIDWDAYASADEIRGIPGLPDRVMAVAHLHTGTSDMEAGHA